MVDWYLVSVLVFAGILAAVFYKDRKNVKRESVLLLRKTKRGRNFLIKLGTKFPRFWKVVGTIGVLICFGVSGYTFVWLLGNSANIFVSGQAEASFMFVLPSASSKTSTGPGYMAVPFWYWIISIALLVLVHEGFHGIMAAMEGIRIKSLGWGLLAIIPLAFVEPDEEQLKKRESWTQLRVFSAGSFANFILAGICLLIGSIAFSGLFVPTGVAYQGLIAGYPAAEANLSGTIVRIDDYTIRTISDLHDVMEKIGSNKTITIYTVSEKGNKSFAIETAPEPMPEYRPDAWTGIVLGLEEIFPGTVDYVYRFNATDWATTEYELSFWEYVMNNYPALRDKASQKISELNKKLKDYHRGGFIGITGVINNTEIKDEFKEYSGIVNFSNGLLFFLILINFGVGVANLLPIKPLDGGRMWEIVFQKLFPKKLSVSMTKALSSFTLLLLIINFVFPILV